MYKIDGTTLTINGNAVGGTYIGISAENDKFIVFGIHGENPHCYKWLDRAVVYDKETEKYRDVRLYSELGRNNGRDAFNDDRAKLQKIWYDKRKKKFFAQSGFATVIINVENVVAEDVKPGFTYESGKPTPSDIPSCFKYKVLSDMSVLITLNPKITRNEMFEFPGFTKDYDMFKLSGAICGSGQSSLVFANTDSNETWSVQYGNSTTMTSKEVWRCRDTLIDCLRKAIPNHPRIRETTYITKV